MFSRRSLLPPRSSQGRLRRAAPWAARGVLVLVLATAGCTGDDASSNEGSEGKTTYRVAVIPKGTTHNFWNYIHAGALKGAAELEAARGLDIEVIWDGPVAENARDEQIQIVQNFVGQNIDGIVLAPLDAHALVGPVQQAMAANKPVVIFDSGLDADTYVSFVATDNFEGGRLAGERIGEILGGDGKVLLLRYMVGSASTTKREAGCIEVLQTKYPQIQLVPEGLGQYAGATSGEAQDVAATLLNTYSDVDAIFCPNESSAVGMLEALKKTGRAGKVKFVGFDASEKLIQGLEDGHIHGLVLQNPVRMGSEAVQTLVRHLLGDSVDRRVDTGVAMVTRDNMGTPAMQALLDPDISILESTP